MKKQTYLKMTEPFRSKPRMARSLHIVNKILTGVVFFTYFFLLVRLSASRDAGLFQAVLVPAAGLFAVTVFRSLVNRPRPYETFQAEPVIQHTKGKSFPSRHVFSAAMIAGVLFAQGLRCCGIICLVSALGLAVIRVVSGVHYISDVAFALAAAAVISAFLIC